MQTNETWKTGCYNKTNKQEVITANIKKDTKRKQHVYIATYLQR